MPYADVRIEWHNQEKLERFQVPEQQHRSDRHPA